MQQAPSALSRAEFGRHVADLYQQLYDLVYLRTHVLTEILVPDISIRRKERAWQLHELLLEAIKELDPGPQAPAFSREWRRHRLLVLRYVDGMDPQMVAREIAVSRRQYYREHDAALEAIADVLWDRYAVHPPAPGSPAPPTEEQPALSDLELLRLEAARLAHANRYTPTGEVVRGVLSLLEERLHQHRLKVHLALPKSLPGVSVEKEMLRQMLAGMLGYLVERATREAGATIRLNAVARPAGAATTGHSGATVCLSLVVEPPEAVLPTEQAEVQERLSAFEEMATLSGTHILLIRSEQSIVGFELHLPTDSQRTVLVVDDNEDVLELFQRYLAPHQYRVVTAKAMQEGLDLAIRLQPDTITLDLMMPEQDGWDLLQALLNRPDTRHIPIIVCSVLKQKELALSLGATAFLKKPVTELQLLSALQALEEA
ncbi:MAG TPA: response regulator [Anaerolineae bacterium]|nr:response regulator [Anaerolineae bacterium]